MSYLEIILILVYTLIICFGTFSIYTKVFFLKSTFLNSTQKSIQILSFSSILLALLWGVLYLPLNYFLTCTVLPLMIILVFFKFFFTSENILFKYKFIIDTFIVLFSIVLWVLT